MSVSSAVCRIVSVAVFVAIVVMFVVVVMVVIVVAVSVSVGVTVATEDYKADEVGEEASASDDEYQLRVFDVGALDESGEGLENDGNAESDEEDGIEEGAQNLGSNKLQLYGFSNGRE